MEPSGRDSNSDLHHGGLDVHSNKELDVYSVLCPYNASSFFISDDSGVCKAVKIDVKHKKTEAELEKEYLDRYVKDDKDRRNKKKKKR